MKPKAKMIDELVEILDSLPVGSIRRLLLIARRMTVCVQEFRD